MSVSLHYGTPGSYKTSGAIIDELPKATKEGRHVITNIRGLNSADNIRKVFKRNKLKVSDSFTLQYIDTKLENGREELRRFATWAPQDAYFMIDEINTIFPKKWTNSKIAEYDTPEKTLLNDREGNTAIDVEGAQIYRPTNLEEALEMHRHYNWDFVLTAPSYKKFHPIFFDVAELAYRHINRAIIGLKGYWEVSHQANNTGRTKHDILLEETKKVPKYIFECYQSTTTGQYRDTMSRVNFFFRPKIILFVLMLSSLIGYAIYTTINLTLYKDITKDESENKILDKGHDSNSKKPLQIKDNKNNISPNVPSSYDSDLQQVPKVFATGWGAFDYFKDKKVYLSGQLWKSKIVSVDSSTDTQTYTFKMLSKMGYNIETINTCTGLLSHPLNPPRPLTCRPNNEQKLTSNIFNPFQNKTVDER